MDLILERRRCVHAANGRAGGGGGSDRGGSNASAIDRLRRERGELRDAGRRVLDLGRGKFSGLSGGGSGGASSPWVPGPQGVGSTIICPRLGAAPTSTTIAVPFTNSALGAITATTLVTAVTLAWWSTLRLRTAAAAVAGSTAVATVAVRRAVHRMRVLQQELTGVRWPSVGRTTLDLCLGWTRREVETNSGDRAIPFWHGGAEPPSAGVLSQNGDGRVAEEKEEEKGEPPPLNSAASPRSSLAYL